MNIPFVHTFMGFWIFCFVSMVIKNTEVQHLKARCSFVQMSRWVPWLYHSSGPRPSRPRRWAGGRGCWRSRCSPEGCWWSSQRSRPGEGRAGLRAPTVSDQQRQSQSGSHCVCCHRQDPLNGTVKNDVLILADVAEVVAEVAEVAVMNQGSQHAVMYALVHSKQHETIK